MEGEQVKNLYTRQELSKLGIYELRALGRDLGVVSPTSAKKSELVDKILALVYGQQPPRSVAQGRGRPSKRKENPCKLYLDLIDSLEEPEEESIFVKLNYPQPELGKTAKAASPHGVYLNQGTPESLLRRGVVCLETKGYFVRRYRNMVSDEDRPIPPVIVKTYSLTDGDTIEYFLESTGKAVGHIFKINGVFAISRKKRFRHPSEEVVVDGVKLVTNESNVVYFPTVKERDEFHAHAREEFLKLGHCVVSIEFGRHYPQRQKNDMLHIFYPRSPWDERESMMVADHAIDRAKILANLENKVVLMIDDIAWLDQVIGSFPTYLYGNYMLRLGKLATAANFDLTVVAVASLMTKERVRRFRGIFDNVVLTRKVTDDDEPY